ncbi:LON peptidase N-terminal domain and RING finger protein 1 isoform X2 [Asparagus officinalis]|uniref:LON peptidase N-terminal domain and RING finger protein 1 isoform X2 n=1 Tax=Asparagus officinalis TaxID=4686 RepID=UPI00098E6D23|nr:LON peptidase N-terminal domain and RING finger protein 1 isoform X2 [Asparagus officinalis]
MAGSYSSAASESYDDVEEFLWMEDENDMGIPRERFSEVFELMRSGNRAFRAGRFEDLERYGDARETLISGLLVDPLSHELQTNLRNLDNLTSDSVTRVRLRKLQRTDDFECTLCLKLLYEPVTTPCGHSFCRACLLQALDHGNRCPMCRTVLFISPRTYPVSVTLNNIIQKNFPDEYAERKSENESLTHLGINLMPLFVMDVVLPCQKLSLNIFEPRYRLMVRRIMEGNHRMGMVILDSMTGSIADVACEVEIVECEALPDGRFYLEVEGRRRFRILESWDQDGYRVAKIEWIEDIQPPEGSPEREDLQQLVIAAAELARTSITNAREAARMGRRSRHMELQAEGMPGPQYPEKFSFWLVNLLNLRPRQRLELLRLRDTRERITYSIGFLRAAEQVCGVQ